MAQPLSAGDHVRDFVLQSTDGQTRSSAEARSTGLLLYAIYKKVCGTCQLTFPFLQRFASQYAGSGFQIWGVSQENPSDTRTFAESYGVTFPQLVDEDLEVTERHGLLTVPGIYLVDASDRILRSIPAFDSEELNAMAALVAKRTARDYVPIVRPEDNAPLIKPG